MAVCFVDMNVRLSGLDLKEEKDLVELVKNIESKVREAHPKLDMDSFVEIDFDEIVVGGEFENE